MEIISAHAPPGKNNNRGMMSTVLITGAEPASATWPPARALASDIASTPACVTPTPGASKRCVESPSPRTSPCADHFSRRPVRAIRRAPPSRPSWRRLGCWMSSFTTPDTWPSAMSKPSLRLTSHTCSTSTCPVPSESIARSYLTCSGAAKAPCCMWAVPSDRIELTEHHIHQAMTHMHFDQLLTINKAE